MLSRDIVATPTEQQFYDVRSHQSGSSPTFPTMCHAHEAAAVQGTLGT
jgi:hypothetical protein